VTDPAPGTEYLGLEDLLDLVNAIGGGPVRDLGLLDSACHRPQASFFGQEAYPALSGKAAALTHSLACNHALDDGNKRLALLATVVFLRINGYALDPTDDAAFDLTMSVAVGQLDAGRIQARLRLAPAPP
jgi:death on curing protein